MEFKEIQDLLKLVNKTDLTEVEIEKKDFKLKIKRKAPESNVIYTTQQAPAISTPAPAPVAPAAPDPGVEAPPPPAAKPEKVETEEKADGYVLKSPMIGTVYHAATPEAEPYVKVGDYVQKGQVLCIIEAMKLFNEIESEVDGKVVKIMVENAQPVEYDLPLFIIDTNA